MLMCEVKGGPGNEIRWLLNGDDLSNVSAAITDDSDDALFSMLTVQNVTAVDGGEYTCVVFNLAGTGNDTIQVSISPYFTMQPEDSGGENGTMAVLTCEADGFPLPEFEWSRVDGEPLTERLTGFKSAMLVFSPLTFGDEGVYICTISSNDISVNSTSATLSGRF